MLISTWPVLAKLRWMARALSPVARPCHSAWPGPTLVGTAATGIDAA